MKKMIMGDPAGELCEEGDSSIAETEDDDDKSEAVSYFLSYMSVYLSVSSTTAYWALAEHVMKE